ncbi:pentatricopeptide repeat-containing protein At3g49740-like [Prosopis cineraria]|uniref:pentatricopeptide repeat-containing protein At3g49740-like n=1 Tax=Prosopis cineraria TaxID=364024 RepID=UPI00240F0F4E|nr:pentatricopeptide repeat-containing protein At3g49740-like [Prosopis cineraria]XP_054783052.1 pentatricopeptide repeat-containing protein At3g49740-like [Prosopis cineraria]
MNSVTKLTAEQLVKLNSRLAELTRSGHFSDCLKLFGQIQSSYSLRPDQYTLSTALTVCANTRNVFFGNQLHAYAIQTGLKAYSFVANSLLSLHAKKKDLNSVLWVFKDIEYPDVYSWTTLLAACTRLGNIGYAFQLFVEMPKSNVAIWNAIITGCTDNGHEKVAMYLFREMHRMDVKPDNYTLASILSLCSMNILEYGQHVHSAAIKTGYLVRASVINSLITMYFNGECVADAFLVFEEAEATIRDCITYNAMIDGLVGVERNEDAFLMFKRMQEACLSPTELTFVSVMSSSLSLKAGCQVQAKAIKMGYVDCIAVNNATMTMYSKLGELHEVQNIFENIELKDLVSWNIMISTYSQENLGPSAILIFLEMRRQGFEPDEFTYGSLLAASDSSQTVETIHSLLSKNGLMEVEVSNALGSAYCRNGKMNQAFQVFFDLPYKNLTSWNGIISGFFVNGYPLQGLELFSEFLNTKLKPDVFTLTIILSICSSISALSLGQQIHGNIIRRGFSSDISLGNALITTYAKSGSLDMSLRVFNAMVKRDTISWNAIISAYAQHGQGKEAVRFFEVMQNSPEIEPDQATFTAVLSACSHAGLVDDGTRIFYSMVKNYECLPNVDHFSCIVDLLGRSGHLEEAEKVINGGQFKAHSNLCWSLFSACAAHGNLRLGRTIAKLLLKRERDNPSVYVLLSNIYAAAGHWEEAANLRDIIRMNGTMKQPGYSWIGV